jgi:hypothetical protein
MMPQAVISALGIDSGQLTGKPEVIPVQKSASGKLRMQDVAVTA